MPNANLIVNERSVVCEMHWPAGYETKSVNGKLRPKNPPSVWPGVPVSQIPSTSKPSKASFKEPALKILKLRYCSVQHRLVEGLEAVPELDGEIT